MNVALVSYVAAEIVSLSFKPANTLVTIQYFPAPVATELRRRKLGPSSWFTGTTGRNSTVCTPMYTPVVKDGMCTFRLCCSLLTDRRAVRSRPSYDQARTSSPVVFSTVEYGRACAIPDQIVLTTKP